MDLNKYDPQKEKKAQLNDWKESVPVVVLSDALKIVGKKHGISLANNNGTPSLLIHPGLSVNGSRQRTNVIEQIVAYLLDAAEDLQELIAAGKLILPESPHRIWW